MTRVEQLWQQAQDEHYPRDTLLVLADAMEEEGNDLHRGVREYVRRKAHPTGWKNLWWWIVNACDCESTDVSVVSRNMERSIWACADEDETDIDSECVWYGFRMKRDAIMAWVHAYVHEEGV